MRDIVSPLDGIRSPFGARRGYSPLSLFSAGEVGAWYDPSDINSYMSGLGSELVTNGTFDTNTTGWTVVSGSATFTSVSGQGVLTVTSGSFFAGQAVTVQAGRTYEVRATFVTKTAAATAFFRAGTSAIGGTEYFTVSPSSDGTSLVYHVLATASTMYVSVGVNASGYSSTWDNISVREVTTIGNATMFQDSAGTTPVTAVEQPVGLVLDKSRNMTLGSELFSSFATVNSPWTASGSGSWSINGSQGSNTDLISSSFYTTGTFYVTTFTLSGVSGGTVTVFAGEGSGVSLGNGTYTYRRYATQAYFLFRAAAGVSATVSNVSVKVMAGNHASQTTSTSRPVLSARVNLLTYSEQFNNAAWTTYSASVSANAGAAPDGSTTADALIEAAATATHGIYTTSMDTQTATLWTISCCVKNYSGSRYIQILGAQFAGQHLAGIVLNSSGVYQNSVTGGSIGTNLSVSSYSITDLGNGWVRATVTIAAATAARVSLQIGLANATTYSPSYLGDGTSGFLLWGADVRPANQSVGLPPYQRVGAATDYDTTGFPYYLAFDGTDDFFVTGTINPGSVDKAQVFAGVRKLSDAASGTVVEHSINAQSSAGSFELRAPRSAAATNMRFLNNGTINSEAIASSLVSPVTVVATGLGDISGDSVSIRINGTLSGSDTLTNQGTGNYGSHAMYIGRRGGTTQPFNGRIYGLIVRFSAGNLSSTDITNAETWMNTKTGAY